MLANAVLHHLDISTDDGVCDATLAYPERAGKFPGVLMLMDAFGPRSYMFEIAQKLASEGYVVLLPNLFYRAKRAPLVDAKFPLRREEFAGVLGQVMPIARAYDAKEGMRDIGFFIDFLNRRESANGKIGITGYCMGGSIALRAAAHFKEKISAVASFHAGRIATDALDSPHRLLGAIRGEIYVAHADNDESMPAEQIARFNLALEESGAKFEAETYIGAAHGFTMKDLPAYNPKALERHWEKLSSLFSRNLLTST